MNPLARALAVAAVLGCLATPCLAAPPGDTPPAADKAPPADKLATSKLAVKPAAAPATSPAADGIRIETDDATPAAGVESSNPPQAGDQQDAAQPPSTPARNDGLTGAPDDKVESKSLPSWLPLALAAGALLLGLIGTILGVISIMERRALQSALGSNPQLDTGEGRARLSDQVGLLLSHIEGMQQRIARLEQEVRRLSGQGGDAVKANSPISNSSLNRSFHQESSKNLRMEVDRRIEVEPRQNGDQPHDSGQWPGAESHPPQAEPAAAVQPVQASIDGYANIDELWASPRVREILDDYNQAASGGNRHAMSEFERLRTPLTVAVVGDGSRLVATGDDLLWFVPLPGSAGIGFVVPGPSPIKNWHKAYRTMMGQQAIEHFGALYEVADGPELTVDAPAWAQVTESGFRRLRNGRLSGALGV